MHGLQKKLLPGEKHKTGKRGVENSQFGTIWMTNGTLNKKIKLEFVEKWKIEGWRIGRTKTW